MLPNESRKLWSGKLPDVVQNKVVGYVEVTQAAPALAVEKHEARKRIFVRVAEQTTGAHIDALAPGVAALRLKSVAHPFCNARLKALVIGTGTPREQANGTDVGIEPRAGDGAALCAGRQEARSARIAIPIWSARPEVADRRQRWNHHVAVIGAERLMDVVHAHIRDHGGQVPADFALNIEVPVHDVIAVGILFDVPVCNGFRVEI